MKSILDLIGKLGTLIMTQYNKIPEDKKSHLTVGLLIGVVLGHQVLVATVVVCGAAIGKEFYDYLSNTFAGAAHEVSVMDAVTTVIGGAIGVGLVQLITKVVL